MDFRFFKAAPEANVQWPAADPDQDPTFTVVALENTLDPDANNHTGFDFIGAYGDGADIDAWASDQPLTAVIKTDLPNPITFYPSPFDQA